MHTDNDQLDDLSLHVIGSAFWQIKCLPPAGYGHLLSA